jgi:large subunit ribosomal protein L31
MKKGIHPVLNNVNVKCASCGTTFEVKTTLSSLVVDFCDSCHPFYTGKEKILDIAGRVDNFNRKRAIAEQVKLNAKNSEKTNKNTLKAN